MEQLYGIPVILTLKVMPARVNQAAGEDLVVASTYNYYDGVTQRNRTLNNALKIRRMKLPVSYGLNNRLVKRDGRFRRKYGKWLVLYGQGT